MAATGQPSRPRAGGRLVLLLEHLVPLLGLTAILLAALAYPFRLHDSILGSLEQSKGALGWLYHTQLRPVLAYTLSPLLFKEVLAGCVLLVLTCVWALAGVLRLGGAGLAPANSPPASGREKLLQGLKRPEWWLVALIVYAALSSLPPMGEGTGFLLRSPTPVYSLKTLIPFTLGIVLLLALRSAPQARGTAGRFMFWICLAGAAVSIVSFLQHIGVQGRWWFMAPWDEPRNRIGSLIGHNTGLSSWLLFPLSFALFYLFVHRRLWVRLLAGGLALLIVFILVAAQSRAVWLLAGAGLPLYLLLQVRALRIRIPARVWLGITAVVLALIAAQVVAPERNPLARHQISLSQRLTTDVLSLDQLLRETRLRVVLASLPLIAERPLLGHGLGSFQWVYPPAQGRYFEEGLGTVTGFTVRRTNVAHTDYFQYLIELGLVGCILLGVPLFMICREAWQAWKRAQPADRARLNALLFPVAAVALHAWIDFPMHIVPVALATAGSLALAAGARNGWARPGPSPIPAVAPAAPLAPAPPAPPAASATSPSPSQRLRPGHVAALSVAGGIVLLAGYATVFLLRFYVADIHFVDGSNWANTARVTPESRAQDRYDYLLRARRELLKALKLDPSHGEAYEKLAYTFGLLGQLDLMLARDAQRRGDEKKELEWRARARTHYSAAINYGTNQLLQGELRWHYTYYLIGQAYRALWRMNPDPQNIEQLNYLKSARTALERAVKLNTADAASLTELAGVLEEMPEPDRARASRLRRIVYTVDPGWAEAWFLQPAVDLAQRGRFAEAWRRFQSAAADAPREDRVKLARARILLEAALWPPPELDTDQPTTASAEYRNTRLQSLEPLLQELASSKKVPQAEVVRLQTLHEAARENWREALAHADWYRNLNPADLDMPMLQMMLAERAGVKRPPLKDWEKDPWEWLRRHRYRMQFFHEKMTGAIQISRHAESGFPLPVPDGMRAAVYLKSRGLHEPARVIARNLLQNHPADPAVRGLAQELGVAETR